MRNAARIAALGALLLMAAVTDASACPGCMDPTGGRTAWFRYTTVILSLVPLAAIGGVAWWIRRQVSMAGAHPGV